MLEEEIKNAIVSVINDYREKYYKENNSSPDDEKIGIQVAIGMSKAIEYYESTSFNILNKAIFNSLYDYVNDGEIRG
jgi:hypothetical protein